MSDSDIVLEPPTIEPKLPKLKEINESLIIPSFYEEDLRVAQSKYPFLMHYTLKEIEMIMENILYSEEHFPIDSIRSKDFRFTLFEDYIASLASKSEFITSKSQSFLSLVNPIFSIEDIEARGHAIKDQNDIIIDSLAEQLVKEEMNFISTRHKSIAIPQSFVEIFLEDTCYTEPVNYQVSADIDHHIEEISKSLSALLYCDFEYNDLAVLLAENVRFSIKRARVFIGNKPDNPEIDIDLDLLDCSSCNHISHIQAVIVLMEDLKFYIENLGTTCFRVNGTLIPPNHVCVLNDQSLLDFSDRLMIFQSNPAARTALQSGMNRIEPPHPKRQVRRGKK